MMNDFQRYHKPGKVGGRLIREVVAFLRSQRMDLPLSSHILIATSGGADSVALAHLLIHYGRRVIPQHHIALLHINHGWRGKESDGDEDFVLELGKKWKVPVLMERLNPIETNSGESWENLARQERKKIYRRAVENKKGAVVFTAHQADDFAETVLWRLLTGAAQTHGGGVAFHEGVEIRPFLRVRKSEIYAYLSEVGEKYREDSTNFSGRFLRSKMRLHLMPEVEKLFPKAVDHLVHLGLKAQEQSRGDQGDQNDQDGQDDLARTGNQDDSMETPLQALIQARGLKVRRSHLQTIFEKWVAKKPWYGEIHLPGGWKLICEKKKVKIEESMKSSKFRAQRDQEFPTERWILERIHEAVPK